MVVALDTFLSKEMPMMFQCITSPDELHQLPMAGSTCSGETEPYLTSPQYLQGQSIPKNPTRKSNERSIPILLLSDFLYRTLLGLARDIFVCHKPLRMYFTC